MAAIHQLVQTLLDKVSLHACFWNLKCQCLLTETHGHTGSKGPGRGLPGQVLICYFMAYNQWATLSNFCSDSSVRSRN